jgi:hypothetical protein
MDKSRLTERFPMQLNVPFIPEPAYARFFKRLWPASSASKIAKTAPLAGICSGAMPDPGRCS